MKTTICRKHLCVKEIVDVSTCRCLTHVKKKVIDVKLNDTHFIWLILNAKHVGDEMHVTARNQILAALPPIFLVVFQNEYLKKIN